MTANDILVTRFARETFAASLNEASGGAGTPVPPQVEYLARYAERLHAAAVVREEVYVDRHYMDEHAAYYSRMLTPPPHTVRRFHLFEHELTQDGLAALLNEALTSSEARQHVEEALTDKYLGFVSIRPIPAAPVGRTVLRTLNEPGAQREIWALSPYDVHLANLRLCVQGLAFEQQDVAVGACATASVWSALSRVAKHEGMRAPTPAEVSAAASRHVLPHGRGMPAASGLTLGQMCEAIRSVGFAPEAMRPRMPEIFLLAVHTYLLSGIPVVLGLWNDEV
ncbi:MAG TPA: hypothetical protein VFR85_19040, partial [Anaeromyxobacteraceae bacterium]|nr:hypothetical protein [Anaeromyxobacteraceae bacterium]